MKTIFAVALLGLAAGAMAACPNHCSGNGKCVADDKCSCFIRYTGADCSQRKCKENLAWADGSTSDAHAYYECSNKGVCDRATGECACYPGYGGAGCHRSECPNACSGHGTCEYLTDLSGGYSANAWDVKKIQGCQCDGGWAGFDCSQRQCPRGDDPLTACPPPGQTEGVDGQCDGQIWTITVATAATASLDGEAHWRVKDEYGEWHKSRPFIIDGTSNGAQGNDARMSGAANQALLDMAWATDFATNVVAAETDDTNIVYTIKLNNPSRITTIEIDTQACATGGCQPLQSGATGVTSVTVAETSLTSGAATYLFTEIETNTCSGRGICDESSGICQCFEGHTGLACEEQTILV
jgi:hypothetical protein